MARTRTQSSEILRNAFTGKILFIKKVSNNKYAGRFIRLIGVAASDSGSGTGTIHATRNPLVVDKEELTKCILIFRKTVSQFTKGNKKIACEKPLHFLHSTKTQQSFSLLLKHRRYRTGT